MHPDKLDTSIGLGIVVTSNGIGLPLMQNGLTAEGSAANKAIQKKLYRLGTTLVNKWYYENS